MRLLQGLGAVPLVSGCVAETYDPRVDYQASGEALTRLSASVAQADDVIVGKLIETDVVEPTPRRFRVTSLWLIENSFKGTVLANATIPVGITDAQAPAAVRTALRPGARFLLLLKHTPGALPGPTGEEEISFGDVSLGLHRLEGDQVLLNPSGTERVALGVVYRMAQGERR